MPRAMGASDGNLLYHDAWGIDDTFDEPTHESANSSRNSEMNVEYHIHPFRENNMNVEYGCGQWIGLREMM